MALMPVAEALARVLAEARPLAPEPAPLTDAHGRVLAADLAALRTQPPADVSAMDGYAVRAADVANVPARLKLVGEVAAGHPFEGTVGTGEAARIFTGGVVPSGADTIIIQEHATRAGDEVKITRPSARGRHIRAEGLDFHTGDVLLARGRRLRQHNLARFKHIAMVRERECHLRVLLHQQNRGPTGIDFRNDGANLLDHKGCQAKRGFIQ